MSAEQTLTSACTLVPNLAHSFPIFVSNNRSAQYRVALSFETTGVSSQRDLFDFKGSISIFRSSRVKSSEPLMALIFLYFWVFSGLLSHIFIRLYVFVVSDVNDTTGIPSVAHSVVRALSCISSQAHDVSNGLASLLTSAGSVWK